MRILMLAQFIYPPSFGGEERFVADLSRELATRGHTVSIVTLWQQGFPEFEVQHGVRIYRVRGTMQSMSFLFTHNDRTYAPPFPDPGVTRALRRIITEEQPDIIHAHNWLVHSFTPLKAWSKAKFVVSLHDYSLICVQKRLMRHDVNCTGPGAAKCLACGTHFYGLAKGPLATLSHFYWGKREEQAVDLFLPVSQATADGNQLDKRNIPYTVMSNFIPDQAEVRDAADPLFSQLPEGGFLLFVGDVSFDKGAEVLLQAYAELHTELPLVFIGRQFLTDIDERLLKNVLLLGPWPHDAVMGAWQRCTIGLVPSIVAETFGIVALEAMSMGKPVVAARNGGLIDVVLEGETGSLVPPGDRQALRQAIQTLLDDADLRARMGERARQHVEAFRATAIVSHFERAYEKLMESTVTNPRVLLPAGGK